MDRVTGVVFERLAGLLFKVACDDGSAAGTASPYPAVPKGTGESASGYPQCGPESTSPGLSGSCCVDLYCIASVGGSCPAAETVQRGYGSGSCGCELTTGPYAPGDVAPASDSKGKDCCYLAGIIGCTGRPLVIAAVARVAGLAAASGWS